MALCPPKALNAVRLAFHARQICVKSASMSDDLQMAIGPPDWSRYSRSERRKGRLAAMALILALVAVVGWIYRYDSKPSDVTHEVSKTGIYEAKHERSLRINGWDDTVLVRGSHGKLKRQDANAERVVLQLSRMHDVRYGSCQTHDRVQICYRSRKDEKGELNPYRVGDAPDPEDMYITFEMAPASINHE